MKIFDPQNRFFSSLNVIADCFLLSIFWTLAILPVVTIFSATVALWDAVEYGMLGRQDDSWKIFVASLKSNLRGSWLLSLSYALIYIVSFPAFYLCSVYLDMYRLLSVMLGFLLVFYLCYSILFFYLTYTVREFAGSLPLLWLQAVRAFFSNWKVSLISVVLVLIMSTMYYNFPISLFFLPTILACIQVRIYKNL